MGRPCFDQPRLWTKLVGQSLPWGVSVRERVVRHDGEVPEAKVDPDFVLGRDPRLVWLLDEERHEELARSRHRHGRGANLAVEDSVLCEADEPDLREPGRALRRLEVGEFSLNYVKGVFK